MISFLAMLALSDKLTFSGGTYAQLAETIEAQQHKPVAVLCEDPRIVFEKKTIEFLDEKHLITRIAHLIELDYEGSKSYAFAPTYWPDHYYGSRLGGFSGAESTTLQWPKTLEEDGTMSIHVGAKVLELKNIGLAAWPKKLIQHPFFDRMTVVVAANHQKPRDVLGVIASAVGAKVEEKGDELRMVPDLREFRKRVIVTLDRRIQRAVAEKRDPFIVADAELAKTALNDMTDKQLQQAFDDPNMECLLEVRPATALYGATVTRLRAYAARKDTSPISDPRMLTPAQMVDKLDLSKPVFVIFYPSGGRTSVQGKVKGENNAGISF